MKTFSRVIGKLSAFMYLIAGIAMTCSVLLTVSDVVLRLFRRPILGTYELVGILAGLMIGFAMPQTSRTGGHVAMDILAGRLPPALSKIFHVFSRILGILFFAIVSWYLVVMGNDFLDSGESSTTLQIPLYPVAYALAVACVVECLVLFANIFEEKETE